MTATIEFNAKSQRWELAISSRDEADALILGMMIGDLGRVTWKQDSAGHIEAILFLKRKARK